MKFNNETIREAVNEWCEDQESTLNKFGDINEWDTSEVSDMSNLFKNKYKFNSSIDKWDVSNVVDMKSMFNSAYRFNQPIGDWDVSKVKSMAGMFNSAYAFNQPINNWDVSNVKSMSHMFVANFYFNQPLSEWNVSNVTDMSFMFLQAERFNQPINNWDVSSVKNMSGLFDCAHKFNKPLNNWDVSNVNDMSEMFSSVEGSNLDFNQPLNDWDVSNVKSMSHMFFNATEFNQPLNKWDVSRVKNMESMFRNAKSFNHFIDNWDLSSVMNMENMFLDASSFKHKSPQIQSEPKEKGFAIEQTTENVKDSFNEDKDSLLLSQIKEGLIQDKFELIINVEFENNGYFQFLKTDEELAEEILENEASLISDLVEDFSKSPDFRSDKKVFGEHNWVSIGSAKIKKEDAIETINELIDGHGDCRLEDANDLFGEWFLDDNYIHEAKAFFKEFKYDIISSKNYFEVFSNNTNEEIGWCYSTMMTSQYYNLTVV